MKLLRQLLAGPDFRQLERPIGRLREIRDSYRRLNVEIYGEELAKLLNEW